MIQFATAPFDFASGAAESTETAGRTSADIDHVRGLHVPVHGSADLADCAPGSSGGDRIERTNRAVEWERAAGSRRFGADPFEGDDVDELEALGEQIATLAAHIHAATHQLLVLIAEFDERRGWELDGHRSCAHWLAFRTGMDRVTAREKVRVARALRDLPRTGEAMSRGELSFAKARALTRAATATNEGELLAFARDTTAADLERTVRSLKLSSRTDEVERERERHRWRSFSVFPDGTGMYEVRGRLDPEVGAVLMRAIEAASDALYRSAFEVVEVEVEPRQRRADAIGLVAERALAAGFGETAVEPSPHRSRSAHASAEAREEHDTVGAANRGNACIDARAMFGAVGDSECGYASTEVRERPDALDASECRNGSAEMSDLSGSVASVSWDASAEASGVAGADYGLVSHDTSANEREIVRPGEAGGVPRAAANGHDVLIRGELGGRLGGVTSPFSKANAVQLDDAAPASSRARSPWRASAHASAEASRRVLSGSRAERYQVVLHVDHDTLRSGVESGRSELTDGTRLSPETARRLSCDAGVVRVTRDRYGSILHVGRRTRTIPPALRRALEVRDGGCRFPGCGSRFVEAHHVVHWADGGETSLTNCCLMCRAHHRLVHEEGYTVHFPPGGAPTFYTPRGLPVPDTPPRLPRAALEALVRANVLRGVSPDGWTSTARYEREADIPWHVLARMLKIIDS